MNVPYYSKEFLDTMNLEGDKLFKLSFDKMCKKFGKEFIDYLQISWKANGDCMTSEEFCDYNNISIEFFNKKVLTTTT
jgi:hypothetical protein